MKNRFVPEVQERYAETWKNLDPKARISSERTIEEALDRAREIGNTTNGIQALITGSLHLVSGALCLLEPDGPIHHLS
jgi:folylpolyglutamate synthase